MKLIPTEALEHTARVLKVLAHPHRLRIIDLIARRELPVGEVAELVGIAPNACSQHLNIMKAYGVVSSRRKGKEIFYRVEDPNALSVLACIRKYSS
jgi:DNA-binding transcriptional ArsR family regulator